MIQRQQNRRVAGQVTGSVEPCEMALMLPTVWDHLVSRVYADGTPRTPSSVLLFNDSGTFKAMLKDADAGLCCWVASNTLAGLFAALEAALLDPEHEWRQDRSKVGDQARRVKR